MFDQSVKGECRLTFDIWYSKENINHDNGGGGGDEEAERPRKRKHIAWQRRVKLIIEAASGGKMPDLIKKKIDHRLDCHHYHGTHTHTHSVLTCWTSRMRERRNEDGTYVRVSLFRCMRMCYECARVLMIIKFLATDPMVQHANKNRSHSQCTSDEMNLNNWTKPDVYRRRESISVCIESMSITEQIGRLTKSIALLIRILVLRTRRTCLSVKSSIGYLTIVSALLSCQ